MSGCNKWLTYQAWVQRTDCVRNESSFDTVTSSDCSPPPAPPITPPTPPPSPPPPVEETVVGASGNLMGALLDVSSRAGKPARLRVSGDHLLERMVLDKAFGASELILEAASTGASLDSAGGDTSLLHLSEGSPPVTIVGFTIRGSIVLNSTAAKSKLDLRDCTLRPSSSTRRRQLSDHTASPRSHSGLVVVAGRATLHRAQFHSLLASAIVVLSNASEVIVTSSVFAHNRAERGPAGQITAGVLTVLESVVEDNTATSAGGAFAVSGRGTLLLADKTVLRRNKAPVGASVFRDADSLVHYGLPAPLGHWIAGAYTCTQDALQPCDFDRNELVRGRVVTTLASKFDADVPYACPSGTQGTGFDPSEQSNPVCSGVCPKGTAAHEGSTSCSACVKGTYAADRGSGQCIPCPYRLSSSNGSTSCSVCAASFFLFAEGAGTQDLLRQPDAACPECPEHASCGWNTTLESLTVIPGHWRLSATSTVMTPCAGANAVQRCEGGSHAAVGGEGYCTDLYTGPECSLCRDGQGLYLDESSGECKECPAVGARVAVISGIVVPSVVVVSILLAACFRPAGQRFAAVQSMRRTVAFFISFGNTIGFQSKLKVRVEASDRLHARRQPCCHSARAALCFGVQTPLRPRVDVLGGPCAVIDRSPPLP